MPSMLLEVTRDAVLMLLSNAIAQLIAAGGIPFTLDYDRGFRFALCAVLIAPTESEWVEEVEVSLPVVCAERESTSTLQRPNFYKNTIVKILVSEAFRGIWYSLEVIVLVWLLQGEARSIALVDVANDFWSVLRAHLLFWPAFSVVKNVVIPAKRRSLVGVLGGTVWGVCLSFSCVACMYC